MLYCVLIINLPLVIDFKLSSPPTSPHRPRRLTSNPVSYVVKLNTKLRQGDKFWCKDN
ncbi:unnamed protein product [Hymenolepis diminuta]|uniref:Uncharacterized protein n=1 Tax=Hymenolepis diminuta TaxID=6216 RepID=A0A564Y9E4_HYMDI|nr:unnamed protein product [Hymenolepis diminuta]